MQQPQTQRSNHAAPTPAIAVPTLRFKSGVKPRPLWTHVYGPEGVGKSSLAAGAPSALFIDAEDGTRALDVARVEFDDDGRTQPRTWAEVLGAARAFVAQKHDRKTLVLDTLDAIEALIWSSICERDGMVSVEGYGYGKGYVAALDEWRLLVHAIEQARVAGYHVVTLSHAWIRPFKNPEGEDFDRYELKLNNKAAGLIKERADVVMFGRFETFAQREEKTKRVRGVSDGARVLHTARTAAYDAKNRHDLPSTLPMSWADYWTAVEAHRPADPKALALACAEKAKRLGGTFESEALGYIERNAVSASALARLNDRINAKLAEKGEQEAT